MLCASLRRLRQVLVQHPTGASYIVTTEPNRDDERPATVAGSVTSQDKALRPPTKPQASIKAETQVSTPSPLPREVEQKHPKQTVMMRLEYCWALELLAAVLSVAASLSIFTIPMRFDNKPQLT